MNGSDVYPLNPDVGRVDFDDAVLGDEYGADASAGPAFGDRIGALALGGLEFGALIGVPAPGATTTPEDAADRVYDRIGV